SDPEWTCRRSLRRHAPLASVAPPQERSMDMADQINVTERSRSPWPWIIGVIVLAILIWVIAQMGTNDNPDVQLDVTAPTAPADAGGDTGSGGGTATPPEQ